MKTAKLSRAIEAATKEAEQRMRGRKKQCAMVSDRKHGGQAKAVSVIDARHLPDIIGAAIRAYHTEYNKKITKEHRHDPTTNQAAGGGT